LPHRQHQPSHLQSLPLHRVLPPRSLMFLAAAVMVMVALLVAAT
jgi:hypothetical protein